MGYESALEHALEDGLLTEDEEVKLEAYLDYFNPRSNYDYRDKLRKASLLRRVLMAKPRNEWTMWASNLQSNEVGRFGLGRRQRKLLGD